MQENRTMPLAAYGVLLICCCCLMLPAGCKDSADQSVQHQVIQRDDESPAEGSLVHLYFSDRENSFLTAENRRMLHQEDSVAFGTQILHELVKGPQKALARTIPAQTRLKAFYLAPNKIAFVDLSAEIVNNHPGGAKSELLTVYSIVNSLILNIPEIEAVKLLVDGQEVPTLAGHIDLRRPFKANMLLIR